MKAIYIDSRAERDGDPPIARRPVSAVMSRPVATIAAGASLAEALRVMASTKVRHLVLEDEAGLYGGVVSDRQIGASWADDPGCLTTRTVAAIVDSTVPTVGASTHVVAAARVMRAAATDAVAVVDQTGAVEGIVTGTDLIGFLARYHDGLPC